MARASGFSLEKLPVGKTARVRIPQLSAYAFASGSHLFLDGICRLYWMQLWTLWGHKLIDPTLEKGI